MNKKLFLGFLALVSLGSCTIQKRQYMSGYYVEWHKQIAKKSKKIDEHYSPKSAIQKNDDQLLVNEGNSEENNMREETNHVMAQVGETKKVISSNENNQEDKLITNVFEGQSNPVTKRELKQQKEIVKDLRKEIKNLIKKESKNSFIYIQKHLKRALIFFILTFFFLFLAVYFLPFAFIGLIFFILSIYNFIYWLFYIAQS